MQLPDGGLHTVAPIVVGIGGIVDALVGGAGGAIGGHLREPVLQGQDAEGCGALQGV